MIAVRRPNGFSMIELLVVIFLIALFLTFIARIAPVQNSEKRSARALLRKLDIALHNYFLDFGEYPPDSGYGLDKSGGKIGSTVLYDPGSLYRYLDKQLIVTDGPKKGTYGPYIRFSDREKQPYQGFESENNYIIVDPWGSPIGYIGSKNRVVHNRDGVDLFSCGPDKKTASDADSGDHSFPDGCNHDNIAYSGNASDANAIGLGRAVLNGSLTMFAKNKNIMSSNKKSNEVLDDMNNWDPEQ